MGYATSKHGKEMALKIHQRLEEIESNDTIDTMVQFQIGRCHKLVGKKKEQYALDLVHPYRLIVAKGSSESICIVQSIEDYH